MHCSWKYALALALCFNLFAQPTTYGQLFSRNQSGSAAPVRTASKQVAKKKPAAKAPSSVQQAVAAMQDSAASKSSTRLVDYNTFENPSFDGASLHMAEDCQPSFESCACCDDCSSCCVGTQFGPCGPRGGGACCFERPGQFFAFAEYIYARPSFSEAQAYVISDSNQPLEGLTVVEFDFDYQSSYRFGGGYRMLDCCAEIVFNYARYRGESEFEAQDTSSSTGTTIFGPYEVNAPGDGGYLFGDADVDLQSYDLGVAKTIPLGGCCNSCCDSCCGGCDDTCCGDCCGGCPAWDITWSAGVRFADAEWSRTLDSFESDFDPQRTATTRLTFEGVGARVGLLGRRYFGRTGCVSMYAKGDLSLLVGDMHIQTIFVDIAQDALPVSVHRNTGRRMIPVTEIEAGVSAHLGKHVTLSSGYFLGAWHDLGMRDEYNYGGNFQLLSYDDANILGFDGFFARAEVAF